MSVSVPSVCGWEADRARPRAGRIDKLADILGVGSTELLGLQEAASLPHQIASARQGIATAAGVRVDRCRLHIAHYTNDRLSPPPLLHMYPYYRQPQRQRYHSLFGTRFSFHLNLSRFRFF